jgi:hypothetical protein
LTLRENCNENICAYTFPVLVDGVACQSTAITDNKFQIPVIGGFAQTLQFFNPSISQPFQHMGIPGNLQERRGFFVCGKAEPFEHRHAEVTSLGKILQDGLRASGIATGVKDHGGVNPKVKRSGIGPGNGRHLLTRVAAGIPIK